MGENIALGRGQWRDTKHGEHLLRTLAIALLATGAVAWAVGVGMYARTATNRVADKYSRIDAAATYLGWSLLVCILLLGMIFAWRPSLIDQDVDPVESRKPYRIVGLWLIAITPIGLATWAFEGWQFVRPDLVSQDGSAGYLLLCVSAVLIVGAACARTVLVMLPSGAEPFRATRRNLSGVAAWGLGLAVVVGLAVTVPADSWGIRDRASYGPELDMTQRYSLIDLAAARPAPESVAGISWEVTAAGFVREDGRKLRSVDPATGETRWWVSKAGSTHVWIAEVDDPGTVVPVRWEGLGSAGAYAADTGRDVPETLSAGPAVDAREMKDDLFSAPPLPQAYEMGHFSPAGTGSGLLIGMGSDTAGPRITAVRRDGTVGPTIAFGSAYQVGSTEQAAATNAVFVVVEDVYDDRARWVVAFDVITGQPVVVAGDRELPGFGQPIVRASLTKSARVEAGVWGVAIGNSVYGAIDPLVVIPAVMQ